jgi:hypothetical protein
MPEQTSERCYICGGSGRRSSFVLAAHGGRVPGLSGNRTAASAN